MPIAVSVSEFILVVQNQNNMAESPCLEWSGSCTAVVFSLILAPYGTLPMMAHLICYSFL